MALVYNDKLGIEQQVDAEEAISSYLFDELGIGEEEATRRSKEILMLVVSRVYPEMVEEESEEFNG